jgi:hypothetical protein
MDPGFEKGKIIFNNMVRLYVNMRKEDYHDLTVKNIFYLIRFKIWPILLILKNYSLTTIFDPQGTLRLARCSAKLGKAHPAEKSP